MFDVNKLRQSLHVPLSSVSNEDLLLFKMQAGEDSIDIMVMDQIGDDGWGGGVSSQEIAEALATSPSTAVNVRINSPGGLAYDGLQIYNLLRAHRGPVTTINEGLAYSAASVIFMAGDERLVHKTSDFGIHRAHGGGYGNQNMMLAVASFLDGLDNHMIELYSERSGNSVEDVTDWIDGDTQGVMGTMFSGAEALESGFATGITEGTTAAAASGPQRAAARFQSIHKYRQAAAKLIAKVDTLGQRR